MRAPIRRVMVRDRDITLIETERPSCRADEVGVEMTVAGVCGSDTHAAAGDHPFLTPPYFPGHEVVGVVRAIGAEVTTPKVGTRITIDPTLPCWRCKMCRTGRSNICEDLQFFGCGYEQGGMADYFTVPASRVHVLPDDISDLDAALIEPLATPVHAERISGGVQDKTVVIVGAGTIGLLMLTVVRCAGARRVIVSDVLPSKRDRALRLGADGVVDAAAPRMEDEVRALLGESADIVFDCVAIESTLQQAVAMAVKGGTVVVVGVPAAPVTVPLPQLQEYQIRLQGSATYMPEDFARAIDLIRARSVRAEDIVTARFPIEHVAEAFAASASGTQVKVVVTRIPDDRRSRAAR